MRRRWGWCALCAVNTTCHYVCTTAKLLSVLSDVHAGERVVPRGGCCSLVGGIGRVRRGSSSHQASHRSRVRVRVLASFLRRKALSPSSFPSTATQDTQDTHPAQPRSCPVQSLVHHHHHCTTTAPPSLRAHPPLHPTAISGSRTRLYNPRSLRLNRQTSAIHSQLTPSQSPSRRPFLNRWTFTLRTTT